MTSTSISPRTFPGSRAGVLILTIAVLAIGSAHGPLPASTALLIGGCLAGFLSGLLGIGGALITVPVLYVALPFGGVSGDALSHAVVGSALATMVPTALAATWAHHRRGAIDRHWLTRLSPWMALGAAAGALAATRLAGTTLIVLFAAQALYYGVALMRRTGEGGERAALPTWAGRLGARVPAWCAGTGIGAFCACVGMGGGSLTVPYMRAQGSELRAALATGMSLNLCIALGGCAALLTGAVGQGTPLALDWSAAAVLGATGVLAAPVGVACSNRLPVSRLALLVGIVNIISGVVLIGRLL